MASKVAAVDAVGTLQAVLAGSRVAEGKAMAEWAVGALVPVAWEGLVTVVVDSVAVERAAATRVEVAMAAGGALVVGVLEAEVEAAAELEVAVKAMAGLVEEATAARAEELKGMARVAAAPEMAATEEEVEAIAASPQGLRADVSAEAAMAEEGEEAAAAGMVVVVMVADLEEGIWVAAAQVAVARVAAVWVAVAMVAAVSAAAALVVGVLEAEVEAAAELEVAVKAMAGLVEEATAARAEELKGMARVAAAPEMAATEEEVEAIAASPQGLRADVSAEAAMAEEGEEAAAAGMVVVVMVADLEEGIWVAAAQVAVARVAAVWVAVAMVAAVSAAAARELVVIAAASWAYVLATLEERMERPTAAHGRVAMEREERGAEDMGMAVAAKQDAPEMALGREEAARSEAMMTWAAKGVPRVKMEAWVVDRVARNRHNRFLFDTWMMPQ